jgi:hypothetical protein
MSISVTCRYCRLGFKVGDHLGGRRTRCPECDELVSVPEDDYYVRSGSRRPSRYDDDDDYPRRRTAESSDDDFLPRKKKKRRKQKSAAPVFLVLGGLLLVAAIGVVVVVVVKKVPNESKGKGDGPRVSRNADPLRFHNSVVQSNNRLARAGQSFGTAVDGCLFGGDAAAARRESEAYFKTLRDIRNEMPNWEVPDSAKAKEFFRGYQTYLQTIEDAVTKGDAQIFTIIEDRRLNRQSKMQQVDQIMLQTDDVERRAFGELQRLEQEFARAHNITLLPNMNQRPNVNPRPFFPKK